MPNSKTLLLNLVNALVREWGADEVLRALSQLSASDKNGLLSERGMASRQKRLLSAVDQIEQSDLAEAQKAALRDIAELFDRKLFLPNTADVREFLIMASHRPGAIKNRSDAFRLLLKALKSFSSDQLERLAKTSRHAGPSRLGPLSDAISDVGSSLPRHREPDA